MNLSYTLPKAEENIIAGVKIHTLREDRPGRWKQGIIIHHSYSFRSERGYHCFLKNECKGVQQVLLMLERDRKRDILLGGSNWGLVIKVDRRTLTPAEGQQFIKNDGFYSLSDFNDWFFPFDKKGCRKELWAGKLIHWTDFKY